MAGLPLLQRLRQTWLADTLVYRATDTTSGELRAQHLAMITRQTPILMAANGINAAVVVVALIGSVHWAALLLWSLLLALTCGWALWKAWRGAAPRSVSPRAIRRAVWRAGWLALLWALMPALWFPGAEPAPQLVMAVMLCGMMGAGAFMLAPVPMASFAWLAILGAGAGLALMRNGLATYSGVAVLLLTYALVLACGVRAAARQYNGRLLSEREAARQNQVVGLLLRDFEEHATDVLWEIDRGGLFTHVSARLAMLLGQDEAELQRTGLVAMLQQRCVETEHAGGMLALHNAMVRGKPFRDLLMQVQAADSQRWWTLTAKPLLDDGGAAVGWRGVISDVTQQRLTHQRLAYLAHYDSLTGLANRVQLRERLFQALEARGDPPRRSALLCLDLDHFKSINDSLGHSVGDGVLRLVAQRLQGVVRRSDLVARLGGDEFAVLLDDVRSDDEVQQLAERLLQVLAAPGVVRGQTVSAQASVGVAYIPDQGSTIDEALGNADLALYAAKEAGRGRCEYFAPWLGERNRRRVIVEQELRHALRRGELSLDWQPWVDTETWQLLSAEALLRWHHPELGLVPPTEFIAVAEKAGLIAELGSWVLMRACMEGQAMLGPLPISVNVSPMQMMRPDLIDDVRRALEQSGLAAARLEIEITENVFLDDTPITMTNLHQLKALGVRVALDDFGTGYSSLAYLRRFPFDTLKIDRAFVRELLAHRDARSIVRTIVDLARVLGMRTVAEGVEEPAQLAVLSHANCHAIQGFLVARPQPVAEMRRLMRDWDSSSRPEADDVPVSAAMPFEATLPNWLSGR